MQRLKRIDASRPIFPKHASELLDRDLIQVRSSISLIDSHGKDFERAKILVAPRPVIDYVLSKMSQREIDDLVRKATTLYFGDPWRTENATLHKLGGSLTSDDGSLLENPHILVLRLLGQLKTWDEKERTFPILNLAKIYCSALLASKHYRNCVTVCRDILAVVPSSGFNEIRNSLDIMLAKSLRMTGKSDEASSIFERLLKSTFPRELKRDLMLCYALCLQSLNDYRAIEIAKAVIEMAPKMSSALQAQALILEMEEDADNTGKLLTLENEARKLGFNTVANNLTLGRVSQANDNDITSHTALRMVYSTAVAEGDAYTAARAVVKLGVISIDEKKSLSNNDLNNLIDAYQYLYGERFASLFKSAHGALWNFFESQGDIRNLLSLFRHSSFIWRLHGNEVDEKLYVTRLVENARQILSTDILTADKNTAYFLIRAQSGMLE